MSLNARKENELDPKLIERVSNMIMSITGVQLGERQREMVSSRLKKRMVELGLKDGAEYEFHLQANPKSETTALVSLLTTHHTYFFREFAHFEYLEKHGLKCAVESARRQGRSEIRIWSAACSHGHEVYSLAMFIAFHLPRIASGFTFKIVGTDVDPESVQIAKNGVYKRSEIKDAPLHLLGNHWLRGTGEIANYVKAATSLRSHCDFFSANLLDLKAVASSEGNFDIIFCRNVFIYFAPDQVRKITLALLSKLAPGGRLFVGISESLAGLPVPVTSHGPSIYSHKEATETLRPSVSDTTAQNKKPELLRVLCVDDSPSILSLMKKILAREHGYEVVATATNGIEAAKQLAAHKVDLVTLDIHMPEQTGLEYLQRNMTDSHPPVVVISSVSRDNADLAIKCLEAGASDYVEKPTLSNMEGRAEEIRTKLQCAYSYKRVGRSALQLDSKFARKPKISDPDSKLRIIACGLGDRDKLRNFLNEQRGVQPATIIMVEGSEGALSAFTSTMSADSGVNISFVDRGDSQLLAGRVYLCDLKTVGVSLMALHKTKRISVLAHRSVSTAGLRALAIPNGTQFLQEDTGVTKPRDSRVSDIVPATSFSLMSDEFFAAESED